MPRKTQKNKKTQKRGGTRGSTKGSTKSTRTRSERISAKAEHDEIMKNIKRKTLAYMEQQDALQKKQIKRKTEYKTVTVDFKNEDGTIKDTYSINVAKNTGLLEVIHPHTKGIFEHLSGDATPAEKEFIHTNIVEVPDEYDVWRKSYLHYSIYKLQ